MANTPSMAKPVTDDAGTWIASEDAARVDRAVELARRLARDASTLAVSRRTQRANNLLRAPQAVSFISALTDEVIRIPEPRRAAKRFGELVREHLPTLPSVVSTKARKQSELGMSVADLALLRAGAHLASRFPSLVMPLVVTRLRGETKDLIIDSGKQLAPHLRRIESNGMRSNVNGLGEAILGPAEADVRFRKVVALMQRNDVDYVSVKLSAIVDNLSALAFDHSVTRTADRLRLLWREATATNTFVNLDMEEYRDLELTVAAFTTVLDEPEFRMVSAGIVLQTYLPDTAEMAGRLGNWAASRVKAGGAPIKVRIVKGANLAMERVEAELRGWELAPFPTKELVDANYKHVLDVLCAEAFDEAVRIGLATHNLFDVAWGLGVQRELAKRNQSARIEFEMLQGMAPAQAAVVAKEAGSVLLYTPVVGHDDFVAAIAYLVRRLDENTAPENFLAHLATIADDPAEFASQELRFREAVARRTSIDSRPRRTQDRQRDCEGGASEVGWATSVDSLEQPFVNEPDTDFALRTNRAWLADVLGQDVPVQLPPRLLDVAHVDGAVARAKRAQTEWAAKNPRERARIVGAIGTVVARERGSILAMMTRTAQKTVAEGDPEISEAVDFCNYYAREAIRIENEFAPVFSEPLGTVVIAPPWNFPYAIALGGVVAALVTGNTVILKPAPQVVDLQCLIAQHCWEAGVPRDVLQFAAVEDGALGQHLITHQDVDAVVLTGAYETAKMFLGWRPDLRLFAETSGKNAMIITASADVDQALKDLVKSAFGHAGQKCSATSLAIVEAALYDDSRFHARLADAVRALRCGPADELATDIAPLIESPSEKLLRALTVLDPGESWLVQPVELSPSHWSPGVRVGVARGSWFAGAECFGPVLGVVRAENLDEAIDIQNESEFGLTGGIHALDPAEIAHWASHVEVGNAYVNRSTTGAIVQRQPFGGWKRSSVGASAKAGGPEYLGQFRRWVQTDQRVDGAAAIHVDQFDMRTSYRRWWESIGSKPRDPSGLVAESNEYRLLPLPGTVLLRVEVGVSDDELAWAVTASRTVGVNVFVSRASDETVEQCIAHLERLVPSRLRVLDGSSADGRLSGVRLSDETVALLAAAHRLDISADSRPAVAEPALEIPRWCRAQVVSETRHRHGHIRNHR